MRTRVALGALFLLGATTVPAGAHLGSHPFSAWAPPCAVVCPYWVDPGEDAPCAPSPFAVDIVTEPAPGTAKLLDVEIFPEVDWDLFLCRDGKLLAAGANLLVPCDGPLGVIGCNDRATYPVFFGEVTTIRLFNWSDPFAVSGEYRYI